MIRTLFGVKARDINFAFKMCRRRVLDHVQLRSEGSFIDAELIIRANRQGFELLQFGVDYFPRTRGESTLSSPKVIVNIVKEMVGLRRELSELRPIAASDPARAVTRSLAERRQGAGCRPCSPSPSSAVSIAVGATGVLEGDDRLRRPGGGGRPTPPVPRRPRPPRRPPPVAPTSSTTPAPTVPARTQLPFSLSKGNEGAEVLALQNRLKALGFEPGPIDGVFGDLTRSAVWAFEKLVMQVPRDEATGQVTNEMWQRMQDPLVVVPRRPNAATANHTEIYLPEQVVIFFVDDRAALISHMSSGTGEKWCEEVTISPGEYGNEEGTEPLKKGECGISNTPGGVYEYYRRVEGVRQSGLGGMWNPVYFNYGIAIHGALNVPLEPASHGCIRIPMFVSEYFQSLAGDGDQVFVFDGLEEPEDYGDQPPTFNWRDPNYTTTTLPPTTVDPTASQHHRRRLRRPVAGSVGEHRLAGGHAVEHAHAERGDLLERAPDDVVVAFGVTDRDRGLDGLVEVARLDEHLAAAGRGTVWRRGRSC